MGFQLVKNPTNIENFLDNNEIKTKYYPEVEALIKRATGASEVFLFDHTVRKSSVQDHFNNGEAKAAGPVARVHCDYTEVSAPRRFRQMGENEGLTPQKVEELIKKRYAFMNVWRPITETPV
jgi:hypothetical protein